MISGIRRIARFVPALCIVSGLLAVFVAKSDMGWIFVGGGVIAQGLFFFTNRRDRENSKL